MNYGTIIRIITPKDLYEQLCSLKSKGFDCCQLVYKPEVYTREDAEIINDAVLKSGVEIQALIAGFRDSYTKWNLYSDFEDAGLNSEKYGAQRLAYVKKAAEFCGMLGVKNMMVHAGFVANNPFSDEYRKMCEIIKDLANFIKQYNMNLLLETGGESPVTLLRLIEDTGCDNVFANLDTANLIMYGFGNPVDAVYTLGSYIKSVHIKDGLPPVTPNELGIEAEFGEGFVDFERFFKVLNSKQIKVTYIIEREIPDGKTPEKLCSILEKVKSMTG